MNTFKKIMVGIVSFAMSIGMVTASVNATSTYYLQGDTTGDGYVNSSDASHMMQFLSGHVTANGYTAERMDLNKDYIINERDRIQLSQLTMGSGQNIPYLQYTDPNPLPAKQDLDYLVYTPTYSYVNTSECYSLNTLYDTTNGSNPVPDSIIGTDDRVQESGLLGVLRVTTASGEGRGTAFVVDSHTLLTAAHVLRHDENFYIETNLQFKIYATSSIPSQTTITPVRYHIPELFMLYGSYEYDYAIVTVAEDLSNYINFDLGVARKNIETETNHTVYVTGFGGNGASSGDELVVNPNMINVRSTGSGSLVTTPDTTSNYELRHNVDTVGGDSGGPLYVINSDLTKTAIGINVRHDPSIPSQYNCATRITPDILSFVYNNTNLSVGFSNN